MQKKVLIIGRNGQVSSYLQRELPRMQGVEVVVAGSDDLDLQQLSDIQNKLAEYAADLIINPAAYTAVDQAEQDQQAAFTINRDAVSEIAAFAAHNDVPLIHYSTDYVFSGDSQQAYREEDATGPTGVYGESKLAGEQAILDAKAPALILRTAWVYSNHGKNFYKTMLNLAHTKNELNVVADQVGAPTYAGSIAEATRLLVRQIIDQNGLLPEQVGIYHFACQGQTSWSDFAKAIFVENEINNMVVNGITTEEYPTPAKRPAFSVLNGEKLQTTFGVQLPHWGTALAQCAAETKLG